MLVNKSITAIYHVKADNMEEAANAIAIGQSIGNPSIRTRYDQYLLHHIPLYEILGNKIYIEFPLINLPEPLHINYLMSVLMGGQVDVGIIRECRLESLDLSAIRTNFLGPRFGIEGIRRMIDVWGRPLIGSIIKPKIGLRIRDMVDVVKKLADGGVDFIKEDEILSLHEFSPFEERVSAITKVLEPYKVIYAPCVTADDFLFPRTHVKCLHINIWCGLGYLNIMRKHVPYGPALFFQKSGDKVWTTGPYSIDYSVICKLVNLIGCDFAHVGMRSGYLDEPEEEIRKRIICLRSTMPSFSCGATPRHVMKLARTFSKDIMVTSGGYIHGHPKGITHAVKEFRREAGKAKRL